MIEVKIEMIEWLPTVEITTDPAHVPYLQEAYRYADFRSDDDSTQNGSLLTNYDNAVEIAGANHFTDGVEKTPERLDRPAKYRYFVHAERDAIFNAAKMGQSTNGLTLYCAWYACPDCARAIIQSGIQAVIGHKQIFDRTPDRWKADVQAGIEMLYEAGVQTMVYDGKIFDNDEVVLMFNSESWQP